MGGKLADIMNNGTDKEKKYDFSLALTVVDIIPCILFGASMILLDRWFRSPLYLTAAIMCTLAGLCKVIWKFLICIFDKNIEVLNKQFKFVMPTGMLLLLISVFTMNRRGIATSQIIDFIMQSPSRWLLLAWLICCVLMVILRITLNMDLTKSNWIAEVANIVANSFLLIAVICLVYVGDYYHYAATYSDDELASMYDAQMREYDGYTVFMPAKYEGYEPAAGMVFYPGGKVDDAAYIPLMEAIADKGIAVVLVSMPDNLAILDYGAADSVPLTDLFPSVTEWYIGGHSLGGATAAMYLAGDDGHAVDYKGIILLGAYSTKDLKGRGFKSLCIYGSEDGVMNREKYEKNRTNLPEDNTELVIEGGCHSFFGDYGIQSGDGTPAITAKEQWDITAQAVCDLMTE